jgi:cardiolipin synthase A/B
LPLNHFSLRGLAGASVALIVAAVALTSCKAIGLSLSGASDTAAAPTGTATAADLIVAPDQGYQSIYQFISAAHTTLDMTMYELTDTTAEQDLAQDAQRGVQVRVILDENLEKSNNQAAYTYLSQHGVRVVWASTRYAATHQKTITTDSTTSVILTGNLTTQYYSTSRDFAFVDTTAADVAAIEQTFAADFTGATITPPSGADLVWSPTTAMPDMLAVINGAKTTLQVENEEMGNATITNALIAAAKRGVAVQVIMTRSSDWSKAFGQLTDGGVKVATYASSASLYIHAKVIVADAGQTGAHAFMGSENFSTASLTRNRELGLLVIDTRIIAALHDTLTKDYTDAQPWSS